MGQPTAKWQCSKEPHATILECGDLSPLCPLADLSASEAASKNLRFASQSNPNRLWCPLDCPQFREPLLHHFLHFSWSRPSQIKHLRKEIAPSTVSSPSITYLPRQNNVAADQPPSSPRRNQVKAGIQIMTSTQIPTKDANTTTPTTNPSQLSDRIARLPKPTRDMINLMLDDGLPYHIIIDELAESGRGLTPQSLTKWLQSGYEDYLKNRENIEEARTRAEFAADLLRELGEMDLSTVHRACLMVASLQVFQAIEEYGDEALRKMLHTKPASWLSLVNTLCNTVQPIINLENHRMASESKAAAASASGAGILPANSGAGVSPAKTAAPASGAGILPTKIGAGLSPATSAPAASGAGVSPAKSAIAAECVPGDSLSIEHC